MKELLIGMGLGFVVGALVCRSNKCIAEAVDKTVDKGKEIIEDISSEVKSQVNKSKKEEN